MLSFTILYRNSKELYVQVLLFMYRSIRISLCTLQLSRVSMSVMSLKCFKTVVIKSVKLELDTERLLKYMSVIVCQRFVE